jgi:hypothetical protein
MHSGNRYCTFGQNARAVCWVWEFTEACGAKSGGCFRVARQHLYRVRKRGQKSVAGSQAVVPTS